MTEEKVEDGNTEISLIKSTENALYNGLVYAFSFGQYAKKQQSENIQNARNNIIPTLNSIENFRTDTYRDFQTAFVREDNVQERRLGISILTWSTLLATWMLTAKRRHKFPNTFRNTSVVYFTLSYLLYKPNINPF